MGFNLQGLRNIGAGGSIADAADPSGVVTANLFHYVTDDDASAVETDGYFDTAYKYFTIGATDIIFATLDRNGTPAQKTYLVNRVGADIALVPQVDAT